MIKVTAIVLFIILGAVQHLRHRRARRRLSQPTGLPAGFMPHGFAGVWMAVIMGVFSFNGIEVIAVTAGEAENPVKAHPGGAAHHAPASVPLLHPGARRSSSPFVPWTDRREGRGRRVRSSRCSRNFGLCYAAAHHEFRGDQRRALQHEHQRVPVLAHAVLAVARQLRAAVPRAARQDQYAARCDPRLGRRHPVAAAVSKLTPLAYNYLFGVALFGAMTVWIFILLSHLSFRRQHAAPELPVRMPFFPWLQIAALGLLVAVLVTMGLDTEFWNISWIVGVPWLVLISIAYFVWRPRRARLGRR